MIRQAQWFAAIFKPVTRRLRSAFRYVTGNPTCLGFTRATLFLVLLGAGLDLIRAIQDGSVFGVGWATVVLLLWLAAHGPMMLREAAAADLTRLGPVDRHSVFEDVLDGWFCSVFTVLVVALAGLSALNAHWNQFASAVCWWAFVPATWAVRSGGGEGGRSLARDVRRLASDLGAVLQPAVEAPDP